MADFGFLYWKRVDELRGRMTLSEIAEHSGIKEQSLRNMRSQNRFPKQDVSMKIAELLGTSVDYLVSGGEQQRKEEAECPEAEFVKNNPEARLLIRAVMEDPSILPLVSALAKKAVPSMVEKEA